MKDFKYISDLDYLKNPPFLPNSYDKKGKERDEREMIQ